MNRHTDSPGGKAPALLMFIPLYIAFAAEWLATHDSEHVLGWLYDGFGYFMISALISACLFFIALCIFNNAIAGFLTVFTAVLVFAAVSYFKLSIRGEPLYASELGMINKILRFNRGNVFLTNFSEDNPLWSGYLYLILCTATALAVLISRSGLSRLKLGLLNRLWGIYISAALLAIVFCNGLFGTNSWNDFSYQKKGFFLGFAANAAYTLTGQGFEVGSPMYTDEYLNDVLTNLKANLPISYEPEKQPNVIVILSESFYDLTRMGSLRLSKDPIPNYRELAKTSVHGNMLSATFGGGTANVEYELLTGMLTRHFSRSLSAYESYVTKPIPSLASVFKAKGYSTVALHTYQKDFYERDRVYPLLGFDRFVGLEDLDEPEIDGFYVSDAVLTDMIIDEYESKTGPVFVFAVSMENHQPYTAAKYDTNPIAALNTNLSGELKAAVEAFAHGLNNADRELKRLTDYFAQADEEVCILFFGDHLPTLGADFELYRAMDVVENSRSFTPEELKHLVSAQFMIWSNFKAEPERIEGMGTNFLGSYLLNYLGMTKPLLYHYTDVVYEQLHGLSREDFFMDADGGLYSRLPEQYRQVDELYRLFQYDIVFGEGYAAEALQEMR